MASRCAKRELETLVICKLYGLVFRVCVNVDFLFSYHQMEHIYHFSNTAQVERRLWAEQMEWSADACRCTYERIDTADPRRSSAFRWGGWNQVDLRLRRFSHTKSLTLPCSTPVCVAGL